MSTLEARNTKCPVPLGEHFKALFLLQLGNNAVRCVITSLNCDYAGHIFNWRVYRYVSHYRFCTHNATATVEEC